MTENEAIEELKYDCNELGKAIPCDISWGESFENAYAMAINALEEVQQYRQIGTVKECREAVEKQISKKPNYKCIKYGKHKWKLDEDGNIDEVAWGYEFCNGVVCERCGETVCVHCNPNYDKLEDCEVDIYICPFCDKEVGYRQKYCDCGQKLDWRNE